LIVAEFCGHQRCRLPDEAFMAAARKDQMQRSLRRLAQAYAAIMQIMEQTFAVLCEDLSLDPLTYLRKQSLSKEPHESDQLVRVDAKMLSVIYRGKSCFLGNTLPFKFLSYLAGRPNIYVNYEELLGEVWRCRVSDTAARSVAKNLRIALRKAGLAEIANAIDGSVYGHYALRLEM
jgi:hypothetical protein